MDYKEFCRIRDNYYATALPTGADFARYTRALFAFADRVNARVAERYPDLMKKDGVAL